MAFFIKKNKKNISFVKYFARTSYKEHEKDFGKFYHPWLNISKRKNAIKYSLLLKKDIFLNLKYVLNKTHNINKNEKFWKLILFPYINKLITIVLETEAILKKININQFSEFHVKEPNFRNINIQNYSDFTVFIDTVEARAWITSIILKVKKKNKIKIVSKKKNIKISKKNKKKYLKKNILINAYNNFVLKYFTKFYFLETLSLKSFLIVILRYKCVPLLLFKQSKQNKINLDFRKKIIFNLKYKNYNKIFTILMKFLTPISYLEGFYQIQKDANFINNKSNIKIFDDGVYDNFDIAKFIVAKLKENKNNKFNMMQHGGGYCHKINSNVLMEKEISDIHYTWGKPIFKNQKQFLSPQIKSFINLPKKYERRIIMPISLPALFTKNMSTVIGGKSYEHYFNDLILFLSKLKPSIIDKIVFRFQDGSKYFDYDKIIKNKFPSIKISYGKEPFKFELMRCNLCICTANATTVLQSFTSGVPTLMFWRKNYYESANFLKRNYALFSKDKIFYDDPVKAAKYLNNNYNNISKIWSKIILKKNYKNFIKNNCHPQF